MPMKFTGTLKDLKRLLADGAIMGSWEAKPNGCYLMRTPAGANMHWARGSKSVWVDGKPTAKLELESRIACLLHAIEDDP